MDIVLFRHPDFMNSRSMPRFADMLEVGLIKLGHSVESWSPKPFFFRLGINCFLRKWFGYIDQYVIFPVLIAIKIFLIGKRRGGVLFVFADQAMGPWVPIVCRYPNVIHCHDFMALKSALGLVSENKIGLTGKVYQRFIRWGFEKGSNFISVSNKTSCDLVSFSKISADELVVIYNGLNYCYYPMIHGERVGLLSKSGFPVEERGMLLHVGGAQWYKNRVGVVEMYAEYVRQTHDPLALWMIGPTSQLEVLDAIKNVPPEGKVYLFSGLDVNVLQAVYSHAKLFLFPSLDEGFGWPIAEAMACGALVLTTGEAPMNEVGGDAAFYLYRRTADNHISWAVDGGRAIKNILSLDAEENKNIVHRGFSNVARFDTDKALAAYAEVYARVLNRRRG